VHFTLRDPRTDGLPGLFQNFLHSGAGFPEEGDFPFGFNLFCSQMTGSAATNLAFGSAVSISLSSWGET
jgi:hypothetical protein